METNLRSLILNEAVRIGDELLAKAETTPHGMAWKTIDQQGDIIQWRKSESIYNGVCGIVLFFAELYKQTHQEKYLHAALEGGRWVEWYCCEQPATSYAFITGRMSVPYTFLQLHQLTQNPAYLEKALTITKAGLKNWEPSIMEYINGLAGTLLCLVHLHAATREPWLLDYINTYTGRLLSQTHLGKKGIYWDRAPVNIHGLCGFSHGASGVGFVLLELGQYLKNPGFYWLSEQAFAYESQFYNEEINNWYDLRKMPLTEADALAQQKAYEAGDYEFFTTGASMNAWCHGAAGIGLARLRAFKLLQKPAYATEARQAVGHTLANSPETGRAASFTLCHGGGGNAEILLQAYELFGEPAYLAFAEEVALAAIQSREINGGYRSGTKYPGEETSLFMGNAGIGYFYLRVLQPGQVPSVLNPGLAAPASTGVSAYPSLNFSVGAMQRKLVVKIFTRTLQLLDNMLPQAVEDYFRDPARETSRFDSFLDDFVQWAKDQMALLPLAESHLLYEVLLVEWLKLQINEDITSDVLLAFKNNQKSQRTASLIALPDNILSETALVVDPDMQLLTTQWKCNRGNTPEWVSNILAQPGDYTLLLMPSLDCTLEQELSAFTATVLDAFAEEKTVAAGIQLVLSQFEDLSPAQLTSVQKTITAQIRQAISAGILLEPEQHRLPVIAQPALALH